MEWPSGRRRRRSTRRGPCGVGEIAVGVRVGVGVEVGEAVTVKLLALFTAPPGAITVITPLVAPKGTVAVI